MIFDMEETPFWREALLTHSECRLLNALFAAHRKSAFRSNVSSVTAINAAAGSGDYSKAVAAAILTIGGRHAPLAETMQLFSDDAPHESALEMLALGEKVPGWGSSFVKGEKDQDWLEVDELLSRFEAGGVIESITEAIHSRGKMLFPNPSAYTAATALIVGIPQAVAPFLFIAARLPAWSQLVQLHL